jgi:hypothetical protein
VDEDEKITPLLQPGELNLPGSVVQHLLYQLRITRTLTNEVLMLFNNCSITELSLLLEFTNASPFSRSNLVNSGHHSTAVRQTRVTDEWLETIAEHHPELLMLDVSKGYRIKAQGVQKIIDRLQNLNSLVLNKCKLINDEAFVRLSTLSNLRTLNIGATLATPDTILNQIVKMPSLTSLDLSSLWLTDSCFVEICQNLPHLNSLVIKATRVTDESFHHISKLTSLVLLDCSFVTLSSQSLWALAHLSHLMTLYLNTNSEVNNEVAPYIADLTDLRDLSLANTESDTVTLSCLAKLVNLEKLDLNRTLVHDEGIAHLRCLTKLKTLSMAYCRISDMSLVTIGSMTSLENLKIAFCNETTDHGIGALSGLTHLTSLDIGSPLITKAVVGTLTKLHALRALTLWETGVRDPSALDPLSRLEYLSPIDQRMSVTDGTYLFKEEEEFSLYS